MNQERAATEKAPQRPRRGLMIKRGSGANHVSHQRGWSPMPQNNIAEAVTTAIAAGRSFRFVSALGAGFAFDDSARISILTFRAPLGPISITQPECQWQGFGVQGPQAWT